jgi:hypothetical protein
MADPAAPTSTSSSSDLKVLIAGTDGRVTLRDKDGNEHVLPPLDMSDLVEFERKIGGTVLDESRDIKLSDTLYLLFLSLRKEGCTDDEIQRGQYKRNERQVYRMFNLKLLPKSVQLFMDIMKISGVEFPPPPSETKEIPKV